MTFENEEQAIEALVADGNAESTPSTFETNTQETPAQVEQGATETSDSNNADLAAAAEEERVERLRAADYTRKTQEIAPLRKFMQSSGIEDVEQVKQAWELASRLQADPVELYNTLQSHLSTMGLLPGNTPQVAQVAPLEAESEYEEIELPPHLQAKLQSIDSLQAAVERLNARDEQFREQQAYASMEREYTRQENIVRELNPNYKEEDMNFVHALAVTTGGNVEDASNLYQQMQQHILGNHIATKSGVSDAVTAPTSGAHSYVPVEPSDDLDSAHLKAKEFLAQFDD